jgi:glycosyltransferase involved in cell wall biosynthesis
MMTTGKRIKILHLISGDLWAGAESQALTLISSLNRKPELELLSITFNQGKLSQELRQLGIRTYVLDEKKNNVFQLFLKVRRILLEQKVEILHSHRYKENVIGGLAACFRRGPYLVKTVHGLVEPYKGIKKFKLGFYNFLDRWITRLLFHRVICVSHDISQKLRKELPNTEIICIRNCVDLERLKVGKHKKQTKRELGFEPDSPLIGTVGRLSPIKGMEYLLRASRILIERVPDLRVLIVGEGSERMVLVQLASKLGLDSHVAFTGHREDVLNLISAMDVFILPSLSEGIPMVLLETMALSVPIVATRVGGIPEILENGQTAFLVPPKDENALADACHYLLLHKKEAEMIAEQGAKKVRECFSAESMAQNVEQIYQHLTL